jgi:hypothetical protein
MTVFSDFVTRGVTIAIVVIIVVGVLLQLVFLCRFSLRFLSLRCHELDLLGFLLRSVLWRVMLRLLLRQHVLRCQLTDWRVYGALAGCAARANHLKFESRRV